MTDTSWLLFELADRLRDEAEKSAREVLGMEGFSGIVRVAEAGALAKIEGHVRFIARIAKEREAQS
jgi:hypothetical protein